MVDGQTTNSPGDQLHPPIEFTKKMPWHGNYYGEHYNPSIELTKILLRLGTCPGEQLHPPNEIPKGVLTLILETNSIIF